MKRWAYRVRQVTNALRARPLSPAEMARVRERLGRNALVALFQTMPDADQRHALEIAEALWARGERAAPLQQAALLHDVAKRELGLGVRAMAVLLTALNPRAVGWLAGEVPLTDADAARRWRRPWRVWLDHAARGAELAARAGADPRAVELIRAHGSPLVGAALDAPLDGWLAALQELDDKN